MADQFDYSKPLFPGDSFLDNPQHGPPEVDPLVHGKSDELEVHLGSGSVFSADSNTFETVVENGRTYHKYKDGKYPLPNDEDEQERLDFQHRFSRMVFDGKLHVAPIPKVPAQVLDIATGTGIWAIEFANEHFCVEPERLTSQVTGTDLSLIHPAVLPTNVTFLQADVEEKWNFTQKFDYIHGRALVSCFKDPKFVLQQAFDNLAPGGYLELTDPIFPIQFLDPPPANSALAEWATLIVSAAARSGRPWTNSQYYGKWMQEIGFVNIVERRDHVTLSPWAKGRRSKIISQWFQHDLLIGIEAWSLALFTRVLGWEKVKLDEFLERVKEEVRDTSIHAYLPSVVIYGRKSPDA